MAEIRINATGGVKLYDADDSHYAQIVAGTITSNVDAITLGHDTVTIADNLSLGSDSAVLKFGADGDTTLTHTDGTGLTLNSTNKICFNDASQFIQGSSNAVLSLGATDEIDLTATAVDLNGTLNVSGVATFQSTPVFPDGSLALADLDIDGGTDIGAAIVDADLFIVDDGAGGTNRKTAASRLKTYIGSFHDSTYFDVRMSADQSVSASTATKVDFDTEVTDLGSNFDTSTQSYTAPTAGYYVFNAGVHIESGADSQLVHSHMKLVSTPDGGSAVGIAPSSFDKSSNNQRRQAHTVSFIRLMAAAEVIYVEGYGNVSSGTPNFLYESGGYTNFFQGWRIA